MQDIACGPLEMRDGGAVLIRPAPAGAVLGKLLLNLFLKRRNWQIAAHSGRAG
jgi:hypothetical protein